MIKVVYIVSSLCNEGPVNVLYNIIAYLDFSRFDVSIVTYIPEKESSRMEEFRRLPVTIYQLSPLAHRNLFGLFFSLKRLINTLRPDILHAHCPRSLYTMGFLPRQYPRVYTIHNYPGALQRVLYGKVKGQLIITLNHYFTKRTDYPIGCAENISTQYKEKRGWEVNNIPNGCSLPLWKGDASRKQQLRRELSLPEGVKYFIAIGRFSKEKNPDRLVRLFKKMDRKDVGLIILGDGPLWETLKQEEEKGRILLPGFTTNVYNYLVAADYYISASDGEGLPNALLECMTIGLPLLLSDIPSHQDVLAKMNKRVGYLFNQHDEKETLEKLELLLQLDTIEVAKEIQVTFSAHYTARKMSESYQAAYAELYNQRMK